MEYFNKSEGKIKFDEILQKHSLKIFPNFQINGSNKFNILEIIAVFFCIIAILRLISAIKVGTIVLFLIQFEIEKYNGTSIKHNFKIF